MKFYIAAGKAKKNLQELHKQYARIADMRWAIRKEFKAKGVVTHGQDMVGLVFKGDPPSPWLISKRLCKHVSGACIPDSSREGRELSKRMRELRDPVDHVSVSQAIGARVFFDVSFASTQLRVWSGNYVIAMDDRAHLPGKDCKRISDMKFEALLAKEKAKRKKSKRKAA